MDLHGDWSCFRWRQNCSLIKKGMRTTLEVTFQLFIFNVSLVLQQPWTIHHPRNLFYTSESPAAISVLALWCNNMLCCVFYVCKGGHNKLSWKYLKPPNVASQLGEFELWMYSHILSNKRVNQSNNFVFIVRQLWSELRVMLDHHSLTPSWNKRGELPPHSVSIPHMS